MIFFYSVSMFDYSNAKIKMYVAVAETLFRVGNDQVAILRWKCVISARVDFFDQEYMVNKDLKLTVIKV